LSFFFINFYIADAFALSGAAAFFLPSLGSFGSNPTKSGKQDAGLMPSMQD
jgi:hypothetical protein